MVQALRAVLDLTDEDEERISTAAEAEAKAQAARDELARAVLAMRLRRLPSPVFETAVETVDRHRALHGGPAVISSTAPRRG